MHNSQALAGGGRPSSAIDTLTCAYSPSELAQRLLGMFKAYIEDSASDAPGDRRLVLAGYVNTVDAWKAFSEKWQERLDAKPKIGYFTMKEAWNLRGEFKGWKELDRDRKISALADVIDESAPWSIHCQVSIDEYNEIVAPVAPYDTRTPYHCCFNGIISTLARAHAEKGIKGKIDFIFDENNAMGPEILMFHRSIPKSLSRQARKVLGSAPVFHNDKAVLPLQAADFLAWHLRRAWESRYRGETRPVRNKLPGVVHVAVNLDRTFLFGLAKKLAAVPGSEGLRDRRRSIRQALRDDPAGSIAVFDRTDRIDKIANVLNQIQAIPSQIRRFVRR